MKQLTTDLPATAYRSKEAVGRWQADTASRTCDRVQNTIHLFAFLLRPLSVKCQMSNVKCSPRGFTLVETLAAVTILSIAIVGPIHLIGTSLHKIYYAKDEMIAINLAQEGIEMVRQVRDTNMLGGALSWNTGLSAGSYTVDAGKFVSGSSALVTSESVLPQPVFIDMSANSTKGLYRQGVSGSTFSPTQFSRIVTIDGSGLGANERKVISRVEWKTGGVVGTISVSEYIFNVRP